VSHRTSKAKADVGCRVQYQKVLDARNSNFQAYFNDAALAKQHQEAHQRLLEVENAFSAISDRREYRLFEMAARLLGDGLCQIATANYQLAFYCLRSFLELSASGVRFSAFEYELREWEFGRRDVSWTLLSGDETGFCSLNFANAFLPEIKDETKHYQGLARRVYRECSEYVHGNPVTHGSGVFEQERTAHWFELFFAACTVILFSYFVRYLKDFLQVDIREDLRLIIESELGHFSEVRSMLGHG
jgi:hypothetical protein